MSDYDYSDEALIAIEMHVFLLMHGHRPDRGECAKICNKIRFNHNDAKVKDLASVRGFYYQQHHRWPSAQEYDQLVSQLQACTTTMARPDPPA